MLEFLVKDTLKVADTILNMKEETLERIGWIRSGENPLLPSHIPVNGIRTSEVVNKASQKAADLAWNALYIYGVMKKFTPKKSDVSITIYTDWRNGYPGNIKIRGMKMGDPFLQILEKIADKHLRGEGWMRVSPTKKNVKGWPCAGPTGTCVFHKKFFVKEMSFHEQISRKRETIERLESIGITDFSGFS